MKSTFIGEESFGKEFPGKTRTLHFDINKLGYIQDAVYHIQTTGVPHPCLPTGTVLCCPLRAGPTAKAGLLAGGAPLRAHVTPSSRAPSDWHPCQISPRTPQGSDQQFVFGTVVFASTASQPRWWRNRV